MKRLSQYYSIGIVVSLLLVLFSSCSDSGYVDAIPAHSSAIVSIDAVKATGVQNGLVLKTLLKATDLGKTGIDVGRKIYLFETTDGNLGICAAVDDASRLSSTLEKIGCKIEEKRGYRFAVVAGSWLAGFSDDALLVMGPVPVSDVAVMQNRMARYLSQEEGQGITGTSMFACLDTVNAPMAMIAQAAALPRQLVMPFTLGAPKDADPSQVIVSAAINISKGVMYIDGTTFSFNKRIDEALKESRKIYRPVKGRYLGSMSADAASGMFLNVDGSKFINVMRGNPMLQAMLAGINAAIDMDNIIKSIDGEMAVVTPSYVEGKISMSIAAELAHTDWLADVGYWKQSVPEGGKLTDWKPNAYIYSGGSTSFCFGVTDDKQFFSGSSTTEAEQSVMPAANPISQQQTEVIRGSRLALIVNIAALDGGNSKAVASMLRPLTGNISAIVFTMK